MLLPDAANSAIKNGRVGPVNMMSSASSPQSFTPLSLLDGSDFGFMLDVFDSEIARDENGLVTKWFDQSAHQFNFIQNTVAQRPLFESVNGISMIRANQGRLVAEKNHPSIGDNPGYLAMFCRVGIPSVANGGMVMLGTGTTSGTGQRALMTMANSQTRADLRANGITSNDAPLASEQFNLYESRFGNASLGISHNGNVWRTRTAPSATTPESGAQMFWGLTGVPAAVDCVAAIYVSRHITDDERINLLNYYRDKSGL
ncbi:hypothetical protein [Pectobacterium parmentieri]|uniref:hypothetical protein n=1 Tax=Pectobacterium parmentieri TaxID=1905730 RepID=UPI000F8D84AD|nr:hypothetical protein [Pectobacterium parmentieri]AZS56787.1 hypothetical protein C5E18_11955 [Pectobacterium parmentieri]MBI0431689.1 hypothetical protein [Pectobacterium parmentieri]